MQPCARIGAQSYDVAGVRGNFRLIKNDGEHGARYWYRRSLFLSYPLRGKSTATAPWYPPVPFLAARKLLTVPGSRPDPTQEDHTRYR
jgi:hypothetical protein